MARILVVDDSEAVRKATTVVLEATGHSVVVATSGMRIEATVEEQLPDLVITDMLMPNRDGVETVLALRRRFPELRIIAMSGGGNRGNLDLGVVKRLGVSATIAKPFDGDDLNRLIARVLAGPPPGRQP